MKLKDYRLEAQAIIDNGGVTKRETFDAAIPVIIELNEKISGINKLLKASRETLKALNESASAYALDHIKSVFGELSERADGSKNGDVAIGDKSYHFVLGRGKFERTENAQISQKFLAELPTEWTKSKLELDATAIKDSGVSDDELAEAGLMRPETYSWTEIAEIK